MLKARNGSFHDVNLKGRILWEGSNRVFFGCLSGRFGSWRLFLFYGSFKWYYLKKIPSRFLSYQRVSSEKIWRTLIFRDVPRISIFARSQWTFSMYMYFGFHGSSNFFLPMTDLSMQNWNNFCFTGNFRSQYSLFCKNCWIFIAKLQSRLVTVQLGLLSWNGKLYGRDY